MNESFAAMAVVQLWQVSVLFLIVAAVGWLLKGRKPHLLLLLWVLFFIKCLVPPVVQSPVSPLAALTPEGIGSVVLAERIDASPSSDAVQSVAVADDASHRVASSNSKKAHVPQVIATRPDQTAVVCSVWGVGSSLVLFGFVGNYLIVRRRIFRSAIGSERLARVGEAQEILNSLTKQIGLSSSRVTLIVSRDSIGPLVFGFVRPTIVLPIEMLESQVSLKPIIAHELCHVWRKDHLLGCIQVAAQVIFWFHPLVWLASWNVNRLCEVCCDEDAVRIFELNSKQYAGGLLDVLSLQRVVKAVHYSPGIRPVEVTKQRIRQIVSNQQPKTRQSQMVVVCTFLCLALPAIGPRIAESEMGRDSQRPTDIDRISLSSPEQIAQRRVEMDFLLGSWNVCDAGGNSAGVSTFAYEKSGKMIREDWIAANGATAQGITFYDPNENCWKMTWVDSAGVIMESSGQWDGDRLTLDGFMTSKAGRRTKAQSRLSRLNANALALELRVDFNGELRTVSKSSYQRVIGEREEG